MRLSRWLVVGPVLVAAIAYYHYHRHPENRPPQVFPTAATMWPLCVFKGRQEPVDLIVDGVDYRVNPKQIYLISKCQEGHVDWFVLFAEDRRRLSILKVESRSTYGSMKRSKEYLAAHPNTPAIKYGLVENPLYPNERFSNYWGVSDDGILISIGCTDKHATPDHYCNAVTEIDGGSKFEYSYDVSSLPNWKGLDRLARTSIAKLRVQ